jgi:alpha-L-arabinofuranosidase
VNGSAVDFFLAVMRQIRPVISARFVMPPKFTRREAVQAMLVAGGASVVAVGGQVRAETVPAATIQIDLSPTFELSPYLFMQFMEPLGATDGSVEAAWDHNSNSWRSDVIEVTRRLAPTMLRWGGIFTDFYRWREGVGPRDKRPALVNLMWGGIESNQVGTVEFCEFARRVHAEPLMCVNFKSDGRARYAKFRGSCRRGDAQEAADWVAYCNDPENAERRRHGFADPMAIRYWQLGNETSYDDQGFDLTTTIRKTVEFSQAMRVVDPSIKIIGWGDSGWAAKMADEAGDHVDMLAFHHMFNPDSSERPVLQGELYRRDPEATWAVLMEAWKINDAKIRCVRESLSGRSMPLAMTECHFTIPGRDRCDVLSTWAAGVSYARILNNHQRHGDVLKIATSADFCGTRWQNNAVMIPVPHGQSYLMPVARVMKLYRHHIGSHAVCVKSCPDDLDVVASRKQNMLFLHVVNTRRKGSVDIVLNLEGTAIASAKSYEITEDPEIEVSELNQTVAMQTRRIERTHDGHWSFPAASVSAVEIELAA